MTLVLLVLLLVMCLNVTLSWARSNASCGTLACHALAASLSGETSAEGPESEAEGNGEEGEEGEEGASEGEGGPEAGEGGEESSEENEEEATAEAEEEAEAHAPHSGRKRHGASRAKGGRSPVVLSKLHLTGGSIAHLKTHDPVASRVEFSFTLAKSMKVRVTLVKQSKPHSHKHWSALSADSLTIFAAKGASRHRLTGGNRLSAGRYRLTLTPAHGRPRSIYVNVRR